MHVTAPQHLVGPTYMSPAPVVSLVASRTSSSADKRPSKASSRLSLACQIRRLDTYNGEWFYVSQGNSVPKLNCMYACLQVHNFNITSKIRSNQSQECQKVQTDRTDSVSLGWNAVHAHVLRDARVLILLLLTVSLLMASFVRSVLAALNRTATSPADKVSVEPRLSNRVSVRSPPCKSIRILNLRHMYMYVHTCIHTYTFDIHMCHSSLMSPNIAVALMSLYAYTYVPHTMPYGCQKYKRRNQFAASFHPFHIL